MDALFLAHFVCILRDWLASHVSIFPAATTQGPPVSFDPAPLSGRKLIVAQNTVACACIHSFDMVRKYIAKRLIAFATR
jgi:hypothetical protein